ncbi:MAG TPA: amino acid adenylation domain-containing protein, partial [Terriglobales bacterium]
ATVADYPRDLCLHQLIEQQAERTPEAIACIEPRDGEPDRTINYRELNGRANQLAHFLRRNGIGAKQKVGIYIDRSLEMMIGLLGIQKSGAAYIPLDPAYPADRVRMTLEDAQPAIVVTRQSLCDSLPNGSAKVVCIDSDWAEISPESDANPPSINTPDDLVYIIFTSGSTGRPKGVQVRHRGVVNLLTSMSKTLNMGPGDVFPALASFAFDMCIPELYLALVSGGQVVIGKRGLAANGEELSALLRRLGATVVHATPTTWNLLLEAGFDGKGLKRVIGAEPLPEELRRRLLEADDSLYNFYGPTETTVWSTFHRFRSVDEPVVVGRPLANTQVYIFDKELQPVPIGVFGEILIGGDGVAAGYLNQPDLTASKFIADPFAITQDATLYKTGDLGRFLPDGRIEFQGRADYQIKIRGYRIELGDIESTLAKHPAVQECAVIAREDVPGDKRLVGYVITAAGEFDPADLRAWIKARLPEHMVPAAFVQLSRLPLSPAGKVDRKSLPAPEYTRPELESKFESPRNSTEETIAEIWAGILKLGRVGIHDNFFELGGHSLLATQVVSRLRQAFSVELPLRAIFEAPTIAGLSDKVQQLKSETNPALAVPLKPVPRNQPLPLSFAQQRLWFLDKLEPDNALYNVPVIMRLKGALQATALRKALNRVVARHESLRTRFAMHDGVPTQAIASNLEIELSTTSVMFVPERVRETEARRLVLAEIERPFNLEAGPLIRAVLVKLSDVDHVLVLNTHHIISDRWSLGVLEDELSEFYKQEVRGEIRELAPLPVQYADYAVWQQQILSGATLEEQLTYWRQQLSGAPASLDLAT